MSKEIMQVNNILQEQSKEKIKKVYMGSKDILVFANWNQDYTTAPLTAYNSMEEEFKSAISAYNVSCEAHLNGFDNIPTIRLVAGCATWTMAMAYGCEMVISDDRIAVKHMIEDVQEAFNVKKPDKIYEHGVYPKITERILEFQRRYGDIMISASDNQSPNDILTEVVCSEEAMCAMYSDPEPIHYLLNLFTQSDIELNKFQQSIIKNYGGHQQGAYLPFGIFLADDNASFLSPETYNEFDRPYNEILAKEFGGVGLHCCMKYEQNLKCMSDTQGFLWFDPQTDFNNIDIIADSLKGKNAIWHLNNAPWQKNKFREYSDEKMLKNAIDAVGGQNGIIINIYGDTRDEAIKLATEIKEYSAKI